MGSNQGSEAEQFCWQQSWQQQNRVTLNGFIVMVMSPVRFSKATVPDIAIFNCALRPLGKERRCLLLAYIAASFTPLLPLRALAIEPLTRSESDYIVNPLEFGKVKMLRTPDYLVYEIALPLESKKLTILQPFGEVKASMTFPDGDVTGLKVWTAGSDLCRGASTGQLRMSVDGEVKPVMIRGQRVLELGSGTGVAGIAAAIGGAASVVLTDGNQDLLRLLQKNVDYNQANRSTVSRLRWGNTEDEAKVFNTGPFDVVMASEVGYGDDKLAALFGTMRRCMLKATRAGVRKPEAVLQATINRGQFDEDLGLPVRSYDAFLNAAKKAGLKLANTIEVNDSQRMVFNLD